MSEEKPVTLNPATVWSVQKAGSREKALKVLEGLSEYTGKARERMRECLASGEAFKSKEEREERYFRYLLATQALIDELYPEGNTPVTD